MGFWKSFLGDTGELSDLDTWRHPGGGGGGMDLRQGNSMCEGTEAGRGG